MSHELFYTSVPQGLQGKRGFCTVGMTANMPLALTERLESLSGYRAIFPTGDQQDQQNPVNWAHGRLTLQGKTRSVLSRVCYAGFDYSQRTNKFAHHIVLEPADQAEGGPAWMMLQAGLLERAWSGEPRIMEARPMPVGVRPAEVARQWQRIAGDAGWGGVLADAFLKDPQKPVYVVYPSGTDVLALFDESVALLPPAQRWLVTFSTYYTDLPAGMTCCWRGVVAGTKQAKDALVMGPRATVVDLTQRLGAPPEGPMVAAARTGDAPAAAQPVVAKKGKALTRRRIGEDIEADVAENIGLAPDTDEDTQPDSQRPSTEDAEAAIPEGMELAPAPGEEIRSGSRRRLAGSSQAADDGGDIPLIDPERDLPDRRRLEREPQNQWERPRRGVPKWVVAALAAGVGLVIGSALDHFVIPRSSPDTGRQIASAGSSPGTDGRTPPGAGSIADQEPPVATQPSKITVITGSGGSAHPQPATNANTVATTVPVFPPPPQNVAVATKPATSPTSNPTTSGNVIVSELAIIPPLPRPGKMPAFGAIENNKVNLDSKMAPVSDIAWLWADETKEDQRLPILGTVVTREWKDNKQTAYITARLDSDLPRARLTPSLEIKIKDDGHDVSATWLDKAANELELKRQTVIWLALQQSSFELEFGQKVKRKYRWPDPPQVQVVLTGNVVPSNLPLPVLPLTFPDAHIHWEIVGATGWELGKTSNELIEDKSDKKGVPWTMVLRNSTLFKNKKFPNQQVEVRIKRDSSSAGGPASEDWKISTNGQEILTNLQNARNGITVVADGLPPQIEAWDRITKAINNEKSLTLDIINGFTTAMSAEDQAKYKLKFTDQLGNDKNPKWLKARAKDAKNIVEGVLKSKAAELSSLLSNAPNFPDKLGKVEDLTTYQDELKSCLETDKTDRENLSKLLSDLDLTLKLVVPLDKSDTKSGEVVLAKLRLVGK